MTGIRDLLSRGSKKVIGHYRLLLASAKNEEECVLYRSRIERAQRLLDGLHGSFPDRGRCRGTPQRSCNCRTSLR